MRDYYEGREIVPEGSDIEPDFIRMDITDMLPGERSSTLQLIKDQFMGLPHTLILHHCNHDTHRPCTTEVLE